MTAIDDQRLAGSVMMIEGSLVTIIALCWLFLRLAAEGEQRQRLLERGLDPRAVRRAVRYGRGQGVEQAAWSRAAGGLRRRSPRRPRRLVDRAQPAVLPRPARTVGLPRDQRG